MSTKSKSRPWSETEKRELARLLLVEGLDYPDVAARLGRNRADCLEMAGMISARDYLAPAAGKQPGATTAGRAASA